MGIGHRLGGKDTGWVFLSASQEARHLDDIIYCVDVLRRRGVVDDSILVFTDHAAAGSHFEPYSVTNVHPLNGLADVLRSTSFRYAVVVCGGHGGQFGLESDGGGVRVSPHDLFGAIARVHGIEVALVLLCQCYAGVFNFMDATNGPPEYVLVGSTNFHPTISALIRLASAVTTSAGTPGLVEWQANLYQLGLFEWLRNPQDVDGDGEVNLIDAYKFAGFITVARLQKVWVRLFSELRKLQEGLASAEVRGESDVVLEAYRVAIRQDASRLYDIQEPWLLHARLASRISFL